MNGYLGARSPWHCRRPSKPAWTSSEDRLPSSPPTNLDAAPGRRRRPLPQDCGLWCWVEPQAKKRSTGARVWPGVGWRLWRALLSSWPGTEGSQRPSDQRWLHRLPEDEEGQGTGRRNYLYYHLDHVNQPGGRDGGGLLQLVLHPSVQHERDPPPQLKGDFPQLSHFRIQGVEPRPLLKNQLVQRLKLGPHVQNLGKLSNVSLQLLSGEFFRMLFPSSFPSSGLFFKPAPGTSDIPGQNFDIPGFQVTHRSSHRSLFSSWPRTGDNSTSSPPSWRSSPLWRTSLVQASGVDWRSLAVGLRLGRHLDFYRHRPSPTDCLLRWEV